MKIGSNYILYRIIFILVCLDSTTVKSQVYARGITYTTDTSWISILNKAKDDNKFIFVDCYATWCAPCKKMEKDVFTNDTLGEFINQKFVAVKIQFDTTADDSRCVKQWYESAREFTNKYGINKFPTFLFFSPNGDLLHEAVGYHSITDFIKLASNALSPRYQYYTLYKNYLRGYKDYTNMLYFIKHASDLGNKEFAKTLIEDYKFNFLYNLPIDSLFTPERIVFLANHVNTSKEIGFKIFYQYADRTIAVFKHDSILFQRFAALPKEIIKYFTLKEEIVDKLWIGNLPISDDPDWEDFAMQIKLKYNGHLTQEEMEDIVLEGKVRWHEWKKDWPILATIHTDILRKRGEKMDDIAVNKHAWKIFLYSNKKTELETALFYLAKYVISDESINVNQIATETDTYANLLYKLGRKVEALHWETRAYKLDRGRERFLHVAQKMSLNERTWIYPDGEGILDE